MTTDAEISKREQQVLGKPPRIPALAQDELPPEAHALAVRIGTLLGYDPPEELAEYFAIMARHIKLYSLQLETGLQLLGDGAIPPHERELAVLRTAWLCRAPYEWSEHVVIGRSIGMTSDQFERITEGSQAAGWNDHQRAILRAVEELFADKMIGDETWAELEKSWDYRQLIELPALVGQYTAVALIQNSLRLPLANEPLGLRAR